MPSNRRSRALGTIVALTPWVTGSIVIAVLGLAAVRYFVPWTALKDTNDVIGNFLQTLSTIFAITLGFVVYMVWGQFNETRSVVEREAREVLDLFRVVRGLPEPLRKSLELEVRGYVDTVLDSEWAALARCEDAAFKHGTDTLDRIWATLRNFEPATPHVAALCEDALSQLDDLGDLRTCRLASSHQRVPNAVWILLVIGSIVMVFASYLMGVESFRLHAFVAGSLAGAVAHLLYLVWDLDNCFKGNFRIHETPFLRVRDAVAHRSGSSPALAPLPSASINS